MIGDQLFEESREDRRGDEIPRVCDHCGENKEGVLVQKGKDAPFLCLRCLVPSEGGRSGVRLADHRKTPLRPAYKSVWENMALIEGLIRRKV